MLIAGLFQGFGAFVDGKSKTELSYDVKTTKVVLSVEACSFIQRSYRGIPA